MELREWRAGRGLSNVQLAAKLEVSAVTIGRYESGARIPDADVMRRIFALTGGAVTPNDFYRLGGEAA